MDWGRVYGHIMPIEKVKNLRSRQIEFRGFVLSLQIFSHNINKNVSEVSRQRLLHTPTADLDLLKPEKWVQLFNWKVVKN